MKVKVNKDKCIGCGMCVGLCSEVFDFDDDGLAKATNENINDQNKNEVEEAVKSCPVSAIENIETKEEK